MKWLVTLAVVGATIAVLETPSMFNWFQNHAWVASLLVTAALVVLIAHYTASTSDVAKSAQDQLTLEKAPNLIPHHASVTFGGRTLAQSSKVVLSANLSNLGRWAVRVAQISLIAADGAILLNQHVSIIVASSHSEVIDLALAVPWKEWEDTEEIDGETRQVYGSQMVRPEELATDVVSVDLYFQFGATGRAYHRLSLFKLLNSGVIPEAIVEQHQLKKDRAMQFNSTEYLLEENVEPPSIEPIDRV